MTPEEIVDKIPCACSDCGMRVTETAQLIEEQLKEERNKAIDECADQFALWMNSEESYDVVEKILSLKK